MLLSTKFQYKKYQYKYYYEKNFDLKVVKKIYDGKTITIEDMIALNPERNTEEICKELLIFKNE